MDFKNTVVKCSHFGCRNKGTWKVRQVNGFLGYVCGRHLKGYRVVSHDPKGRIQ